MPVARLSSVVPLNCTLTRIMWTSSLRPTPAPSCRPHAAAATPPPPSLLPQVVMDGATGDWGETLEVKIARFGLNKEAPRGPVA